MSAIDRLFWILDRTDGLSEDIESALTEAKAERGAVVESLSLAVERIEINNYEGEEDAPLATIRAAIAKASRA